MLVTFDVSQPLMSRLNVVLLKNNSSISVMFSVFAADSCWPKSALTVALVSSV